MRRKSTSFVIPQMRERVMGKKEGRRSSNREEEQEEEKRIQLVLLHGLN
jgi:hypothetical protein